ncbi:hypothetical protein BSU04_24440 [Caballeronia sordidicola]|uniref:Uncharacterized protein n=1 Tax=Caballeronia sordidicola TaxID=196367 RepID=A0A226WZ21_CABSO|nr:hypothetical protein BSU04_24440 [Caballeronia sordidicola]
MKQALQELCHACGSASPHWRNACFPFPFTLQRIDLKMPCAVLAVLSSAPDS